MPYANQLVPRSRPATGLNLVRGSLNHAAVANADNLIAVYRHLASTGGQAPGRDRIRYSDLSVSEYCAILRDVSAHLLHEDFAYRPGDVRIVTLPKPDGGTRELRLRPIIDRVISKAVQADLQPVLERIYLPTSFGFRGHLSVGHLLAHIQHEIRRTGWTVFCQDDVSRAFDSVQVPLVLEDLNRHITCHRYQRLVGAVLRGHNQTRMVGIDQGDPLSPDALNTHLHHRLDLPLLQQAGAPKVFVRYADNVAWVTKTDTEGRQTLQQAQRHLQQCGLALKSTRSNDPSLGHPVDLTRKSTDFLGFQIRVRGGELQCDLQQSAWSDLRANLDNCHQCTESVHRAQQVLSGWIAAYGPAFRRQSRSFTSGRIKKALTCTGFSELANQDHRGELETAFTRWTLLARADQPGRSENDPSNLVLCSAQQTPRGLGSPDRATAAPF